MFFKILKILLYIFVLDVSSPYPDPGFSKTWRIRIRIRILYREKMQILSLKDGSILETRFVSMTNISSRLLMTIAKKESTTHIVYLLLQLSCV
jgi:hypothetical protein